MTMPENLTAKFAAWKWEGGVLGASLSARMYGNPNQSSLIWLSAIRLSLMVAVAMWGVFQLNFAPQWGFLGLYFALSAILVWQQTEVPQLITPIGLAMDLLFIGGFLYVNDGVMSGWVSALLFPAVAGSLTCSKRVAWIIAVIAMMVYGALVYVHLVEMADGSQQHMHYNWVEHSQVSMSSHIQGMLITFCISVTLITGFISHQAEQVRKHQQTLTALREKQWRERQIMTFATLSANTTHRLASPISTIALLLDELDESDPERQWLDSHLLQQLQQQTQRCSDALHSIAAISRNYHPDQRVQKHVKTWLTELVKSWWVTRNEVQYQLNWTTEPSHFDIIYDENLNYALVNFLDNAADACQNAANPLVVISSRLDTQKAVLIVDIHDNGKGIPAAIAEKWGRQFVSSTGNGLGIGATLAHAAIEQSGGDVALLPVPSLAAHEQNKYFIQITLPLFQSG